jgi:esterase/lipase superfamily enzyme
VFNTKPNPAMPKNFWMITNRNIVGNNLGDKPASLSYWISERGDWGQGTLKSWERVDFDFFRKTLVKTADKFPRVATEDNELEKHVSLFIHGYNNRWDEAVKRYKSICSSIFEPDDLGECILFTWPSNGQALGYLPDREDARKTAADLADVLMGLYDWLTIKQKQAATDDRKACRAKTSIIAHSMGNYVLQKAMQIVWTRNNQPLLISLINQLLMIAADTDNDLFGSGEAIEKGDGDAIANLVYRITAFYSGRDGVLGASAGLKHFGKRRLGRSGLDGHFPLPDNVWQVNCSNLFTEDQENIHSAYFENADVIRVMQDVLRGIDRTVVAEKYAL